MALLNCSQAVEIMEIVNNAFQMNVLAIASSIQPKKKDRELSIKEAMQLTGFTEAKIYYMLRRNSIPAFRRGKLWRFKESELQEFMIELNSHVSTTSNKQVKELLHA